MKLFIASDIHGSSFYCKKMVSRFKEENADYMILLGDILYHGPRNNLPKLYNPKEVIGELNALKNKIICVRGNCDTEVDQMVLDFPINSEISYFYDNNILLFLTHGHIFSKENAPSFEKKYIFLYGHTHIPEFTEFKDFYYVNPGSVSIPKNGSEHSYILYENGMLIWKNLDGKEYMKKSVL